MATARAPVQDKILGVAVQNTIPAVRAKSAELPRPLLHRCWKKLSERPRWRAAQTSKTPSHAALYLKAGPTSGRTFVSSTAKDGKEPDADVCSSCPARNPKRGWFPQCNNYEPNQYWDAAKLLLCLDDSNDAERP